MSTVAAPFVHRSSDTISLSMGALEDASSVIPVHNHNPTRRMSVCGPPSLDSLYNAAGQGPRTGLFGNIQRKFSKAMTGRHDGVTPFSQETGTGAKGTNHLNNSTLLSPNSNGSVKGGDKGVWLDKFPKHSTIMEESEATYSSFESMQRSIGRDTTVGSNQAAGTNAPAEGTGDNTARLKRKREEYDTASSSSSSFGNLDDSSK